MTPDDFQRALASADAMALAGREPAYWCGFKRGLQRAHHGRRFSSNTDHYAWLDFARDDDPFVAQLGRGYRAGMQAVVSGQPLALDGHGQPLALDGHGQTPALDGHVRPHRNDGHEGGPRGHGHEGHDRGDGQAHGRGTVAAADGAAAVTGSPVRTRS